MATQFAVMNIDDESRREMKENEWLKREVEIYRKDVHHLEVSVCRIEQENLQLINHLFDCRLQDLKISRNTFLTQVSSLDLPADGLLGEDLANLHLDINTGEDQGLMSETLTQDNLLHEEKEAKEYLQLGPLELKLLSVMGQPKPIHKQSEDTKHPERSDSRVRWPVTPRMIKSAFP
ncbi:hypothetical protein GDO81_029811 [Engystomops pustulosus]|uniref:Uncharacterized protein n=1 Tax=Engystomops pustulosus TaxID=76066 RepID=A0AAV6ZEW3_ENGPU|nr:hypothetical protein GDO81_029811 [Engystomops pustulosus]